MKKARYLSTEEKLALLRRIESGERLAAVAEETGVLRKSLYEWRAAFRASGAGGLNKKRGPKPGGRAAVDPPSADAGPPAARPPDELAKAKARIGELERLSAASRRTSIFFAKPCGHGTTSAAQRRAHLFATIEKMIGERPQGEPTTDPAQVAHLCAIAGLSRASYYRWREPKLSARDDANLRD